MSEDFDPEKMAEEALKSASPGRALRSRTGICAKRTKH